MLLCRLPPASISLLRCPFCLLLPRTDVFGPEDRFLNLFAQLQQRLPRMPLVDGGQARVQPLFVQDLSAAIFKIAMSEDPEFMLGQTYDLAGARGRLC